MDKTKIEKIIREMPDEERQELADEIEKSQSARWKPEVGELYWYVLDSGIYRERLWRNDGRDTHLFARGGVFRTEEECIANDKRIKAIQKIKDYIADRMIGREPLDWSNNNQRKYYVYYSHISKRLELCLNIHHQEREPCFYAHKDIMQQAIVDLEDEYKLMLEIGE